MSAPVAEDSGPGKTGRLAKARLGELIEHLRQQGFRVLGPVPRNGGIVFDEVRRFSATRSRSR